MKEDNIEKQETTENKSDEKIAAPSSEEIILEPSELNKESDPEIKQDQSVEAPVEIKKESVPEKNIKKNIKKKPTQVMK